MAITTVALGIGGLALLFALFLGPRARIRIVRIQHGPTYVNWDAEPMQVQQPGFVDGRPIKINARCLGIHYVSAAGEQGGMEEIWFPYVWLFLGGMLLTIFGRWLMSRRAAR